MKLRSMKWLEHVAHMGEKCMQTLVGKCEGQTMLEGPRCSLEVTIMSLCMPQGHMQE